MSNVRWYCVCSCCDAKWFQRTKVGLCPRCAHMTRSRERLPVPWLRTSPTETQASTDAPKRHA
jgi:hypothetical protein